VTIHRLRAESTAIFVGMGLASQSGVLAITGTVGRAKPF
jgi:hypothetical protein